jgi:hypothetical protein
MTFLYARANTAPYPRNAIYYSDNNHVFVLPFSTFEAPTSVALAGDIKKKKRKSISDQKREAHRLIPNQTFLYHDLPDHFPLTQTSLSEPPFPKTYLSLF